MITTQPLKVRAFTAEDGHFNFELTREEWRAELPAVADAYMLPVREYQHLAALKKARQITGNTVLSYGFVN